MALGLAPTSTLQAPQSGPLTSGGVLAQALAQSPEIIQSALQQMAAQRLATAQAVADLKQKQAALFNQAATDTARNLMQGIISQRETEAANARAAAAQSGENQRNKATIAGETERANQHIAALLGIEGSRQEAETARNQATIAGRIQEENIRAGAKPNNQAPYNEAVDYLNRAHAAASQPGSPQPEVPPQVQAAADSEEISPLDAAKMIVTGKVSKDKSEKTMLLTTVANQDKAIPPGPTGLEQRLNLVNSAESAVDPKSLAEIEKQQAISLGMPLADFQKLRASRRAYNLALALQGNQQANEAPFSNFGSRAGDVYRNLAAGFTSAFSPSSFQPWIDRAVSVLNPSGYSAGALQPISAPAVDSIGRPLGGLQGLIQAGDAARQSAGLNSQPMTLSPYDPRAIMAQQQALFNAFNQTPTSRPSWLDGQ
jgi:hypothetical protein